MRSFLKVPTLHSVVCFEYKIQLSGATRVSVLRILNSQNFEKRLNLSIMLTFTSSNVSLSRPWQICFDCKTHPTMKKSKNSHETDVNLCKYLVSQLWQPEFVKHFSSNSAKGRERDAIGEDVEIHDSSGNYEETLWNNSFFSNLIFLTNCQFCKLEHINSMSRFNFRQTGQIRVF